MEYALFSIAAPPMFTGSNYTPQELNSGVSTVYFFICVLNVTSLTWTEALLGS